jgi:hypothetical protein
VHGLEELRVNLLLKEISQKYRKLSVQVEIGE